MNQGRYVFTQLVDFLPRKHFDVRIFQEFADKVVVCFQVGKDELRALMAVVTVVIVGNHLGTMARLVVWMILAGRVYHAHVECHLSGIVGGDEHVECLLASLAVAESCHTDAEVV